ncbi:MAG: hypothetical protein HY878_04685 [Deltaproteobacteria bacterium]|nr:hypothetical protein [Deltaproteobacteria bacterium]
MQYVDLGKNVMLGAIAGIAWGWVAMAVNAVSGAFQFEGSLSHNLVTFAIGGALFGIVVSGFLSLLQDWLPFRSHLVKAICVATMVWIVLFMGSYGLAVVKPERYVFEVQQGVQGFILAIALGVLLGLLWRIDQKKA